MRKACCILLLVTLCVVCIACKASPSTSAGTGPSDVPELIAEADRLLASQDFDGAMERSLRALELSAVSLKATEAGRPLYRGRGFADDAGKYSPMTWRPSASVKPSTNRRRE